jgi:ribonuclease HI
MNKRIYVTTDGSAIANENGGYDSASSFVIFDNTKIIKEETNLHIRHTNNYAEMYAIYKSTKFLLESNLQDYDEIIIVTDSELCLNSLTVWMKGWLKKATNEKLVNSKGELVKNQELIKSAFINILMINPTVPVRIYHINSHEPESKKVKLYEKVNKKIPDLTYDEFDLLYKGNNKCDVNAREALKNHLKYNN